MRVPMMVLKGALSSLAAVALLGAASVAFAQAVRPLPYMDPALPKAQRAADLVSRMTLDEKISEMRNSSEAIPRLGVPAYDWWNEALHGVARSGYATMFPQAIGMAATWDAPLLKQVGDVISTEARAKNNEALAHDNHSIYYGLTFWSPNINIFRDPRWGRGQETYGEDPFLTATLSVNFVRGLQGSNPEYYKVIATPKHFAVHSGPESERHRFDVTPSPHDLWDTYLPAFRATIVDAKADSIMCAYNAIDGQPACGSDLLMQTVLRGYWNFQGFVTSDCGAVADFYEKNAHHTQPDQAHAAAAALLHGTDTNCGQAYKGLGDAVKDGLISEADIDVSLRRLFEARMRLGMFDPPSMVPYRSIPFSEVDSAAHRALALEVADKSMVLLKNDGILPLRAAKYKTIAVIGPNAAALAAMEGNYNGTPRDLQMPVDALRKEFAGAHVVYAQGASYADGVTVPVPRSMLHPSADSTEEGLKAEYFATNSVDGKPVVTRVDAGVDFDWHAASPVAGAPAEAFGVRWSGTITPPQVGKYDFEMRLAHCYPCGDRERFSVAIDGKVVGGFDADTGAEHRTNSTPKFSVTFGDTKPHAIVIEYLHKAPLFGAGISFDWYPPADALRDEAVEAARKADVVVAMMGLSPNLEGEEMSIHVDGFSGGDRTDIKLPAAQQQMLEAVAATGKPLVVVLLNGSALAVNWSQQHANAIVEAWYPGEEGARAIADTLAGTNNPSGRLPVTFYTSLDELPAFTDYSMKNRTYRYFSGTPLYGFGYGLSYTHFAYSHVKLSTEKLEAGKALTVEADVKNTGARGGDEVAELYLTPPRDGNDGLSPKLSLEGFQRLHLAPGEVKHVTFTLSPRDLSEVDAQGVRSVQAGRYEISVGGSQPKDAHAPEATQTAAFTIMGTQELLH
jgi:beta-glucosidase